MFTSTNPKRMKFYTLENAIVFDITLFRIFCFVHLVGTIQHGGQVDMLSGSRLRGSFLSNQTSHGYSRGKSDDSDVETLIEQLLQAGDLVSAETVWKEELESAAASSKESKMVVISHPVNFKTTEGFLMTTLKLHGMFSIYFQIKTTNSNGLIMYAGSSVIDGEDFVAIEMVNGLIRYIFNIGTGIRIIRSNTKVGIADNSWHNVGVLRPTLSQHILRVDDMAKYDNLPDDSHYFELNNEFYVGGLPEHLYDELPRQIKSKHGFQGCLASVDLDGESRSLLEVGKIPEMHVGSISAGCEGPDVECTPTSCLNGGQCHQHWNTFTCDCGLTSFTGPTCSDDGVAYTFGLGGGAVRYKFTDFDEPRKGATTEERLAFGINTRQRQAVLVYIRSDISNDFLRIELVDGNVSVLHRINSKEHEIKSNEKVNDGNYHTVRFISGGHNSSLQIDDNVASYKIHEVHGSFLGSQSSVIIGAESYMMGRLNRPFHGSMAGLVINGLNLMEMAADGDERVTISGNLVMDIKPIKHHQSQAISQSSTPSHVQFANFSIGSSHQRHSTSTPNRHASVTSSRSQSSVPFLATRRPPTSSILVTTTSRPAETLPTRTAIKSSTPSRPLPKKSNKRKKLHKLPKTASDDLIVSRATRTECPPETNNGCSEAMKNSDAFLYPTTKVYHRKSVNRQPFDGNEYGVVDKDSSGDEPCSPDDEDCVSSSGGGDIMSTRTTKLSTQDDIVYVQSTYSPEKVKSTLRQTDRKPSTTTSVTPAVNLKNFVSEIIAGLEPTAKLPTMSPDLSTTPDVIVVTVNELLTPSQFKQPDTKSVSFNSGPSDVKSTTLDLFEEGKNGVVPQGNHGNGVVPQGNHGNVVYNDRTGRSMEKLTINIGLILGIAFGIAVLLLVLAFALYKYKNNSSRPCKAEDTKGYVYQTCNTLPTTPVTAVPIKTLVEPLPQITQPANCYSSLPRRKDVKEWYV